MAKIPYKLIFRIARLICWLGSHIKWEGWLHPFWVTFNPQTFRLKARHYRQVVKLLQPGDILVRRYEGYLNTMLIPGWWNHTGLYVGDYNGKHEQVIHALAEGVRADDLIDFMRTDHMIALRLIEKNDHWKTYALKTAAELDGKPYDFVFDFDDDTHYCCTELIAKCYAGVMKGKRRWGRNTVTADDIMAYTELPLGTDLLYAVWDSRTAKEAAR